VGSRVFAGYGTRHGRRPIARACDSAEKRTLCHSRAPRADMLSTAARTDRESPHSLLAAWRRHTERGLVGDNEDDDGSDETCCGTARAFDAVPTLQMLCARNVAAHLHLYDVQDGGVFGALAPELADGVLRALAARQSITAGVLRFAELCCVS
jgi:hypothetical protein